MSNRFGSIFCPSLVTERASLDTVRLQIPAVSVLSPSAIAFESFIECFLGALCQHHPGPDRHLSSRQIHRIVL